MKRIIRHWRCKHESVRCVHGDEINVRSGRKTVRRVCVACDASLPGPLPETCSVTGRNHH